MKKELLFGLITVAFVLLFAIAAESFAAADGVPDGVQYNVLAERVFVGTVQDKPRLFEGRMFLTIRTSYGLIAVEIGPKDFVERSGFKFDAGELVTVVGMPIVMSNREMVLAREITKRGTIFLVRDRNGHPLWNMNRPIQMDPEVGDTGIPVC